MKTKKLIMVWLLLGMAFIQLSAQIPDPPSNNSGTDTTVGLHVYDDVEWMVYCNNEQVDVLKGTISANYEVHFKNGNCVFANHHCTGEAVSIGFTNDNGDKIGGTGEVFKIIDIPCKYDPTREFSYQTVNCLGNEGSHYIATFAWENNEPWGFEVIRAVSFDTLCLRSNPTRIELTDKRKEIQIYPNPTDGIITIDIQNPLNADIEIYKTNGRLIYSKPLQSAQEQIDLSTYPKGLYFIKVRSKESVRTKKIIKL